MFALSSVLRLKHNYINEFLNVAEHKSSEKTIIFNQKGNGYYYTAYLLRHKPHFRV